MIRRNSTMIDGLKPQNRLSSMQGLRENPTSPALDAPVRHTWELLAPKIGRYANQYTVN